MYPRERDQYQKRESCFQGSATLSRLEHSLKKSYSNALLILKSNGMVIHWARQALYMFSGVQFACLANQTAVRPCRSNSALISLPRCSSVAGMGSFFFISTPVLFCKKTTIHFMSNTRELKCFIKNTECFYLVFGKFS